MPSRLTMLAIVLFWLSSAAWLVIRQLAPEWGAGEPPPVRFEIADEIGRHIRWKIYEDDKYIGALDSNTKLKADGTFELSARYRFFQKIQLLKGFVGLQRIHIAYRVTPDGDLSSMKTMFTIHVPFGQINVEMNGQVAGNEFHARLIVDGLGDEKIEMDGGAVKLDSSLRVVDTMLPMHQIPDLEEGRRWKVPRCDPVAKALDQIVKKSLAKMLPISLDTFVQRPNLIADVRSATLEFKGKTVTCWRIDYAEPGQEPMAKTWVRRRDGVVLQQQAQYMGKTMTLRRFR